MAAVDAGDIGEERGGSERERTEAVVSFRLPFLAVLAQRRLADKQIMLCLCYTPRSECASICARIDEIKAVSVSRLLTPH